MPPHPHWRRALPLLAALLSVVLLPIGAGASSPAPVAPQDTAGTTATPTTEPRLIFGASARPRGDEDAIDAMVNLEAQVDRPFAANRSYLTWDSEFPTPFYRWLAETGHLPMISVGSVRRFGDRHVLWRDIAAARPGSVLYDEIVDWAERIKAYGVPLYFTFNHEPEASGSDPLGTDREFIAAWRKIVDVFDKQGVTNAKYLWIMTGYSFVVGPEDHRYAAKWYPGDAYVDALGANEFNDYTCRDDHEAPWRDLTTEIEPFRLFGRQHPDEELWLPEFGTFEDPEVPGRKGAWFETVRDQFKDGKYAQFRGLIFFNGYRQGTPCEWWADSSPSSLAGLRSLSQDPYWTARSDRTSSRPPGDSALLVVGDDRLRYADAVLRDRLVAAGLEVVVVEDAVVTRRDTAGRDVVVVSPGSNAALVGRALRMTTAPVITSDPRLYRALGLTDRAGTGTVPTTGVQVVDRDHPLADGRAGWIPLVTADDAFGWGEVGPAADVVATVDDAPALFSYAVGDPLPGGTRATGCRIGFPTSRLSPPRFTTAGRQLFDAAVAWAMACDDGPSRDVPVGRDP